MENLDLDINNYNIRDLEKFFKLKKNKKYTEEDIELKEYKLREQLLNSGHIDKVFKRDLIEFLRLAKEYLIFIKCRKNNIISPKLENNFISRENEIVEKPKTQYIYSNNNEFFPGKLNQLNTRVITKCINIDTRFRDNLFKVQSSDFVLQLPLKFTKVVSMQLASFELPICFYGISSAYGNNHFYIQIEYNNFDDPYTVLTDSKIVIIPDGNYNSNDLITYINEFLCPKDEWNNMINPNSIFSYIHFYLNITDNGSGSGKVTLEPSGKYGSNINWIIMDFTKDINGNFDSNNLINVMQKFGWNLGFINPIYAGLTTYTAESIIEPTNIRYIYLAIDDFNNNANNHFVSILNNNFLNNDVLARISLKGSNFSILMENNLNIITEPRTYFGPVDIQKLRIRLYDEYGRILQMNNANYSFCLNLKILYDL
jgi:hypothetical protein